MRRIARVLLGTALGAGTAGILLAQASPTATRGIGAQVTRAPRRTEMGAPERAFQANCSRCHYAPESLSPRITGTVVRHMRVRAILSAEDERLILKYLNP